MRVLITGVTGMVGSHLAEQLLAREDVDLFGTCRVRSRMDNLVDLVRAGKLHQIEMAAGAVTGAFAAKPACLNLVEANLTDPHAIRLAIAGVRPDRIFHLAAQSFVPTSWQEPAETIRTNMIGQVNLFEALRSEGLDAFVHVAGSSEEYGLVYPHEVPISE
ncbi:MAG: GDP-mannose 4,6-dehydratase, partial [Chloroflexi bacterium]|nr:GDP-mannose 4,6-dehydratase [Chloroflexota bacterium]